MAKILILFLANGLANEDNIPVKLMSKIPSSFIHFQSFSTSLNASFIDKVKLPSVGVFFIPTDG